jgi:hypothetical protein
VNASYIIALMPDNYRSKIMWLYQEFWDIFHIIVHMAMIENLGPP